MGDDESANEADGGAVEGEGESLAQNHAKNVFFGRLGRDGCRFRGCVR
jgi:hypothetical protein